MRIYNNETVVGVFDSDKNVDQAISKLAKIGLSQDNDDEIQVVDQSLIDQQPTVDTPAVTAAPAPGTASPGAAVIAGKSAEQGNQGSAIQSSIEDMLEKLDVDGDEATFYARQVARGAKLMVVKTDAEHAPLALDIFKQSGANALTAI
jgi:hypothetical protein